MSYVVTRRKVECNGAHMQCSRSFLILFFPLLGRLACISVLLLSVSCICVFLSELFFGSLLNHSDRLRANRLAGQQTKLNRSTPSLVERAVAGLRFGGIWGEFWLLRRVLFLWFSACCSGSFIGPGCALSFTRACSTVECNFDVNLFCGDCS